VDEKLRLEAEVLMLDEGPGLTCRDLLEEGSAPSRPSSARGRRIEDCGTDAVAANPISS
jgi:hypothetical protein